MGLVTKITSTFLSKRLNSFKESKKKAAQDQADLLNKLLEKGSITDYGQRYGFNKIRDYDSFSAQVPLVEYEDFSVEIKKVLRGEKNVIWPDEINWVAMSSGTTNDKSKFIPVSDVSLKKNHYKSGQDLLAQYISNNKKTNLFDGYSLVLGGSRQVTPYSPNPQIFTGDISAVLLKNLPFWARVFRTPSIEVALNPEWEEKIKKMAKITSQQNITSISGVPTWTIVLIKEILKITKSKNILEVWPNLELFIHGAVSFDPYRQLFKELIPSKNMNYLETYNASEGFFAFQDTSDSEGMLLMTNHGVYYEFEDLGNRTIVSLEDVKIGKQYALIISTYSGLWRYKVGDTVAFISLDPYKILITGRTKQFINAFGEELIVQNTDKAISNACLETNSLFYNYTAAPLYISSKSRGAHEWIIEFIKEPDSKKHFINILDKELMKLNSDYEAKRYRNIAIKPPQVHFVKSGFFDFWLKSKKKLGGQHKVPRLSNDRKYVDDMLDKVSNFQ